ncbi:YcjF family protein [Salinibius halmophilus]|uniref:YcjF family protein n=1 Tax=Salinibius halmophilus TaxID=1853216 RepID=UPI0018F5054E|nr:GTPase [Salinibius halmophilus]
MKTRDRIKQLAKRIINPPANELLQANDAQVDARMLPTLWLLGKTGAGKSSLVQAVTGNTAAEIGLGFKPCTQSAMSYQFPQNKPLMRFLDTRGLGEVDYQAQADIDACQSDSSAIVVVMKLDDPEQSSVLAALKQVQQSGRKLPVIVVHSGLDLLPEEEIHACQRHNQQQVEAVVGTCENVAVNLNGDNIDPLLTLLAQQLPFISLGLHSSQLQDKESQSFHTLRNEVLWYAGVAGGSDIFPVVGLVSVPSIQAKMLHSLGQQFGVEWGKREYGELIGALGAGFGIQYSAHLGLRQLTKLIPAYGQTIGAASAAAISFSTTYALGRVAAKYLFHKSRGESVSQDELKALYRQALTVSKQVAEDVEDK